MLDDKSHRKLPHVLIEDTRPLGAGNERRLLNHPKHPERALKVFVERRPEMAASSPKGWAIRNLVWVRNRRQRRELECYLDLHLRGATTDPNLPIARIIGFCNTDHGPALEVEKIRAINNGRVGSTLRRLLAQDDKRERLPDLLNNLMDRLEHFEIFVSDANRSNIIMTEIGKKEELVLVDGFGDYRTIRWFAHAPWMIRRSIVRSFAAQADFWQLPFDHRRGRFTARPR